MLAITKYEKGSHVLYLKNWEIKLPYSHLKFLCVLSIANKSLFMKTKGEKLYLCSKRSSRAPYCVLCISFSYVEKTIGKKVKFSIKPPTSKRLLQSMTFLSQLVFMPHTTCNWFFAKYGIQKMPKANSDYIIVAGFTSLVRKWSQIFSTRVFCPWNPRKSRYQHCPFSSPSGQNHRRKSYINHIENGQNEAEGKKVKVIKKSLYQTSCWGRGEKKARQWKSQLGPRSWGGDGVFPGWKTLIFLSSFTSISQSVWKTHKSLRDASKRANLHTHTH